MSDPSARVFDDILTLDNIDALPRSNCGFLVENPTMLFLADLGHINRSCLEEGLEPRFQALKKANRLQDAQKAYLYTEGGEVIQYFRGYNEKGKLIIKRHVILTNAQRESRGLNKILRAQVPAEILSERNDTNEWVYTLATEDGWGKQSYRHLNWLALYRQVLRARYTNVQELSLAKLESLCPDWKRFAKTSVVEKCLNEKFALLIMGDFPWRVYPKSEPPTQREIVQMALYGTGKFTGTIYLA